MHQPQATSSADHERCWHVLRTTYGRERKAYDYIVSQGGTAFCPTERVVRRVQGKIHKLHKSLLPNLLFVYGTLSEVETFVFDNVNLPFVRFYYRYFRQGGVLCKAPVVVPQDQMDSFRIICQAEDQDVRFSFRQIQKFREGQRVRVVRGPFAGVCGRVARYKGQQRVAVEVESLFTAISAYIPAPYLERLP